MRLWMTKSSGTVATLTAPEWRVDLAKLEAYIARACAKTAAEIGQK